jgi:tRNA-splicing ligase RtcB
MSELRRVGEVEWELPASGPMRVPGRVFADTELLEAIGEDGSLDQLRNVATLPGVVDAVLAMPDVHQGYGFPVGGVAATQLPDGVVSPGGVGFDINCGVRLLAAPLAFDELGDRREALVHEISRTVPAGTGRGSGLGLGRAELERVLADGPRALEGIGTPDDVELTESGGRLDGAEARAVSQRARQRGSDQLGTLGSGNHFLEVQRVDRVHDGVAAEALGLAEGQVTILIHSGSRGLGHQVCTDFVKRFQGALDRYGIRLADRQLACAPASSEEGRSYLAARRPRPGRGRSTTSPTTWRRSSATAAASCASTERAPPAPSRPARARSRSATGTSASRCSSRAAWARRATSWRGVRVRWSGRSGRSATAQAGASAAPPRASG